MNKTIVEINSCNFGSTGNIMLNIANVARESGYNVVTFGPHGRSQKKGIAGHRFIGHFAEIRLSDLINTFTGFQGSLNYIGTYLMLKKLDKLQPDIIHLHNVHSNFLNLNMLFRYIYKNKIKVVWTFHDCWPFTGHCPHFEMAGCDKWKTACQNCPIYRQYPETKTDRSRIMFKRKKTMFTSPENMVIVTPSEWLADLTRQSFLQKYPVKVINNGIDLSVFKPKQSDFREKYALQDKFVILGVAFSWGINKGLDRFEKLAEILDERFQIVLIGIDKQNVRSDKIICISRTHDQAELADIYSASDVLMNPTREDNFPTVNMEALACGTPVISFGAGGSAEAFDETSGVIAAENNITDILEQLYERNFSEEACVKRAQRFDKNDKFREYVALYDELTKE